MKESCHENLHTTLSDLRDLVDEVHSPKHLASFLKSFIRNLQRHLALEENNLFPFLENGHNHEDALDHLIDDHDQLKSDLLMFRKMTQNYQEAFDDDSANSRLYSMMKEMDRILLNHIQIEDHILFPMVRAKTIKAGRLA